MKPCQLVVPALCALVLFVSGCVVSYSLEYTAQTSDCDRELTEGYYNLNQTLNSFVLNYVRSYHCIGSELSAEAYLNLSKIIVVEKLSVGPLVTGCVCPRMVTVGVSNLRPGNYIVEVRDYNYMSSREPAFVQDIVV